MSEMHTEPGRVNSRETPLAGNDNPHALLPGTRASRKTSAGEGSLFSHLLYGMGTLLFVLPLFLPGVSMFWVTIVYGSVIGGLAIGLVAWALVSALRKRRRGT